jgi:hypothetical protein
MDYVLQGLLESIFCGAESEAKNCCESEIFIMI